MSSLEKLGQLRNVFGQSYSESTLMKALSKAGYSVEGAVGELFSGNYKEDGGNSPTSNNSNSKSNKSLSSSYGSTKSSNNNSFETSISLLSSDDEEEQQQQIKGKENNNSSDDGNSSNVSITFPPPFPLKSDKSNKSQKTHPKSSPNSGKNSNSNNNNNKPSFLLICDRWFSLTNTTRDAYIPHNATVIVNAPPTNTSNTSKISPLRYSVSTTNTSSSSPSGTVPLHISKFLSPLLSEGLAVTEITTLMELRRAKIGEEVPVSLKLRLKCPDVFDYQKFSLVVRNAVENAFHWAEHGDDLPYEQVISDYEDDENDDDITNNSYDDDENLAEETTIDNIKLPEQEDISFKDGTTQTHKYQLQAMAFMHNREVHESENDNEALNIFNDFESGGDGSGGASSRSATPTNNNRQPLNPNELSRCNAGPVVVSKKLEQMIGGDGDDFSNTSYCSPLYDKRFMIEHCAENTDDVGEYGQLLPFYANKITGELSMVGMTPPKFCRGGILADEMGLGKTVEMLGCVLMDKTKVQTLVLTPLSLLDQWIAEINSKTNLKVIKYVGAAERARRSNTRRGNHTTYSNCMLCDRQASRAIIALVANSLQQPQQILRQRKKRLSGFI